MAVNVELQLNEFDEINMQSIKKDMLREDLLELKGISEGEISLDIVYCYTNESKLEVRCFIRNGSSSEVNIDNCKIELHSNKIEGMVGETTLTYSDDFGKIGAYKAVYLDLFFEVKEGLEVDKEDLELRWSKELEIDQVGEVNYPFLEKVGNGNERKMLQIFIDDLPPIRKDSVKFDTFSIGRAREGGLEILFMARNSNSRPISVTKFPMKVLTDDEVLMDKVFETEFIRLDGNEGMILRFPLRKEFLTRTDVSFDKIDIIYG